MKLGSMEAGGTKFVMGVGNEGGGIEDRLVVPTTSPEETVGKAVEFLRGKEIEALGIGSFGPVDLDESSPSYGSITTTPKIAWANFPLLRELKNRLGLPVGFDTDVNAAALGEQAWGAGRGLGSLLYMTVGTGIGVGAVIDGKPLHGMTHPEMGHILVRREDGDAFPGTCPYHRDCLEGLAAGPAIEARRGVKGQDLDDSDAVWELESAYIAQALMDYLLVLSPERMILGGGVMKRTSLFPLVRRKLVGLLAGYVRHRRLDDIDGYVVPPGLGEHSGLKGGFALAFRAAERARTGRRA
ncbi:MAG: ROK family protein [Spirochaetes bacterium]|nr:ROK family protein [Spirochaetota bacterium]